MYAIVQTDAEEQVTAITDDVATANIHDANRNMVWFGNVVSVSMMVDGRVHVVFDGDAPCKLGREGDDTADARIIQVES